MTEKIICLIYKTDTLFYYTILLFFGWNMTARGKKMYPYYCAKDKFKSRVHSLDGNPHVKENLQISQIP